MRRRQRTDLRLQFLGFLLLCGIAAMIGRLWWVQVARGSLYASKIAGRSEVKVRLPSIRGEIRDRNGIPLVQNRASYEVDFYLPDMVRGYRQRTGESPPRVHYKAPVRGMLKEMQEPDIVHIVNTTIIPRLQELELAKDYNAKRLQRHFRTNTEVPYSYIEDVDFTTLARFSEHDVGLPGVDITIRPVRQYLHSALAAHLLGYVGAPKDISAQPDVREFNFYQPDVEGKSQVELYMDKWLRGTPGVRVMQRNVKGVIEGEVRVEPPKPGNNVFLTIDARIQYITEQALRAVGRGAAVVVDPNSGDILAMASVPSYDPNSFIPSISAIEWAKLREDDTDPLTNRAISAYAPGSSYKIIAALAGLRKGIGKHTFTCSGGVTYGNKYMKCWVLEKNLPPHGTLRLADAIKVSCNAFFYQYGNAAGIDNFQAVGEALGLGQRSGIELSGESEGILPGPDWLRTFSPMDRWSSGHTANVSIGQGYVLATPLQMAMATATVANGGISYQPRLIDAVMDQSGNPVIDEEGNLVAPQKGRVRANLQQAGLSDDDIELIRRGMWKVVNEDGGTARRARLKDTEVAGKTGTAQFWRGNKKDNHTWFISFAPYDQPTYAVCVFVQGAKAGGAVSAPIAAKILEESLALAQGVNPTIAALAPAKGSFKFIDQVDFQSGTPAASGGDLETAEHTDTPDRRLTRQTRQVSAEPDIQPEADDQGRIIPRAQRVPRAEPAADRRNVFRKFFQPEKQKQRRPQKPRWPF